MTEAMLFEKVGRLTLANEEKDAAYAALLQKLADVVSGKMERSRLLVNLTEGSYTWSAPGTRPGTPATINGLPVVVTAPDEPPPEEKRVGPLLRDGKEVFIIGRDFEIVEVSQPKPPESKPE